MEDRFIEKFNKRCSIFIDYESNEFHSDWNLLMLVKFKIKQLGFRVYIDSSELLETVTITDKSISYLKNEVYSGDNLFIQTSSKLSERDAIVHAIDQFIDKYI